jgi:hypothetical protein
MKEGLDSSECPRKEFALICNNPNNNSKKEIRTYVEEGERQKHNNLEIYILYLICDKSLLPEERRVAVGLFTGRKAIEKLCLYTAI